VIGVELIDVARQGLLWGETYRRPLSDLLAVQTSIATEISSKLRARLTPDQLKRVANTYTQNVEAYQFYLKGLYHRQKTTEQGFLESLKYFRQAIDLDPTYPLAYVGLSDTYGSLGYLNLLAPHDVWPKAKAAAEAALRLDDTLGEAHAALGHALMRYDWNLAKAQVELERAIALNPRYAIARHWHAHWAIAMGQPDQVLAESRKAVDLEPLDLMLNAHLLFMLRAPSLRDELNARITSVREIEPEFWAADAALGNIHLAEKDVDRGFKALELSVQRSDGMPLALYNMARACASAGLRKEAQSVLAALERRPYVPAVWVASVQGALGDRNAALTWLERGYQERDSWLIELRAWPSQMKAEPRFQDLMRKMGLQQ
jgi:serine/threonine-protein kinase